MKAEFHPVWKQVTPELAPESGLISGSDRHDRYAKFHRDALEPAHDQINSLQFAALGAPHPGRQGHTLGIVNNQHHSRKAKLLGHTYVFVQHGQRGLKAVAGHQPQPP